MERKIFNEEEMITLTLIAIFSKEKRRVVDDIDLENYKDVVRKSGRQKNVEIQFVRQDDNQGIERLEECLLAFNYQNKNYYALMPSKSIADLYNQYKEGYPKSTLYLYSDLLDHENISERTTQEQCSFSLINSGIVDIYVHNHNSLGIETNKKMRK